MGVDSLNLCRIEDIKLLLKRHGFRFSKSLGQNFLIEDWVPARTAEESGANADSVVLEIGPGIGPLTQELAKRAKCVLAVELDRSLLPVLEETMTEFNNVEIISADVMKLDLKQICRERAENTDYIVCANLPYNITTPVIVKLMESNCFSSITVMIQKEVAARICAKAGTSDYGAFSVFCQYYADCEILYDVPPEAFYPAPRVMSSVVRMVTRDTPPVSVENPELFFRVVRAAFAQRRKTLLNALHANFGSEYSKEELGDILESCSLSKSIRGERLEIESFAQLAKKLQK